MKGCGICKEINIDKNKENMIWLVSVVIFINVIIVSTLLFIFNRSVHRIESKIDEVGNYSAMNDKNIIGLYVNVLYLVRKNYIEEERYEDAQEIQKLIEDYKRRI